MVWVRQSPFKNGPLSSHPPAAMRAGSWQDRWDNWPYRSAAGTACMAQEGALRALQSAGDAKHLPSASTSQAAVKQHGEVPSLDQAQFSAAPAELGTRLLPVVSLTGCRRSNKHLIFCCPGSLTFGYLVPVRKQKFLSEMMKMGRTR